LFAEESRFEAVARSTDMTSLNVCGQETDTVLWKKGGKTMFD
jgi:hypothetical protein